jgi:hypothetical protein
LSGSSGNSTLPSEGNYLWAEVGCEAGKKFVLQPRELKEEFDKALSRGIFSVCDDDF